MEEIERLRTQPVPDEELNRAVGHACGTLAASLATQSGPAATLTRVRSLGLPHARLWNRADRLRAVTPDELRRAAQDWLRPDRAAGVTVSPVTA
ncbi:hypothetical protein CTZ27_11165 [Streptomyces griseocarneus]|nr:hypothetical protein CTZ27_11165 [Streptomyces griseocarneus]